jgi:hypothetical protein
MLSDVTGSGEVPGKMVAALLFLCIGFMIAVLYIDLVFDASALSYRDSSEPLSAAVLGPIATYYRYITRNPYLLMLVMLTALGCILAQIVYGLAPRWAAYASLSVMAANMLVAVSKVIPTAKRLAGGKDEVGLQSHMVHSMLPYHLALLAAVLLLAIVQLLALAV